MSAHYEHQTVRIAELEVENRRLREKLTTIARNYNALLGAAAAELEAERRAHDDSRAELAAALHELFRMEGLQ